MVIQDGKEHLLVDFKQDIKIHVEVRKDGPLVHSFLPYIIELTKRNRIFLILWIKMI